jgi:hypothetical protein
MCMYMCLKVNKIQQPTLIIVTIDHCPIIIFFHYSIVEPFVLCVFLVDQCQKKIHQAQVKQNNKQ